MTDFKLYDFQREDVDKLKNVRAGLIASEMGTGKTYEAHELSREAKRTLWIGPLPTLEGSYDKQEEMGLDRQVVIIDPKNRNGSWNLFERSQAGLYMVHWDVLRLIGSDQLRSMPWDMIIADEVHRAQNRKTQQTRALKGIRAAQKFGMSGTPVTGSPDKYWSVLNWLYPHDFRSYWNFYKRYVDYDIVYPQGFHKITGPKNEDELKAIVAPYYVRHLKKEQCCPHHPEGVTPWLPDKYYTEEYVDLLPLQRKAYNQMKDDLIAWVGKHEDQALVAPVVIAQMMRLQQFAVAYAQLDAADNVRLSEPSSKIDRLMQIIEDNPDQPIVVWSQFKQLVYLIEARLKAAGIDILLYTGDNKKDRDDNVKSFAAGGAHVFAGTISAGGVGVDGLQYASNTCVFLDRLWSPALNAQAEDRLWRDGQKNAVQVIDIMARNTVDRGRQQRLEMVWGWIKRLLNT